MDAPTSVPGATSCHAVLPRSFAPRMLTPSDTCLCHFRLIRSAEWCDDPEERFIRVLQYYLAGWHIKPKGVKKP